MNMHSLRSLACISVYCLVLSNLASGEALAARDRTAAKSVQKAAEGLGKMTEGASPEAGSEAAPTMTDTAPVTDSAAETANSEKPEKGKKKARKAKDESAEDAEDDKASKEEKEKPAKEAKKPKVEAPSAADIAAAQAAAERAKVLKLESTPFNTASSDSSNKQETLAPLTLRSTGGSLRSRLVPNRVYLPPKMIIGRPADFVVKGRPGSHVAVAMADKDSGAKPVQGHPLRLGADRKLMAAGVIPESGILTLIVDMPIQGDLIGLPVFFETAIWNKPDFSDLELAAPVKSETIEELADKPNAVIVAGETQGDKGRGIKFRPDSATPLHQRGNVSLESGRP